MLCHSSSCHVVINCQKAFFFIVGKISGTVGEIMASEISTMLYDAVTSSYIGGKNLSLMKSREKFRLTSEGFKQQMTSVFSLAKHTLAEQQW